MPLPILNLAEMREWERATWDSGQTEAAVIRLVGKELARHALAMTSPGELLLVLAGKGHNGDDARAAREYLSERRVDLLDVNDPTRDLSRLEALLSLKPNLIIDGLFGIGLNRPLDQAWCSFINRINDAKCPVLAVDVPSGLDGNTGESHGATVRATVTLTVGAPKHGLIHSTAVEYVGRLEVTGNVGLVSCPVNSVLQWSLPSDFEEFPPPRSEATHKGTYGHLSIVAGSLGFHGAAVLTARGAQRAQPGLITLFTTEAVYHPVASQLQAVMVSPHAGGVELPKSSDAVLVGPGLAGKDVTDELKDWVRKLWTGFPGLVVIDASALDWLPRGGLEIGKVPDPNSALRVITPHPGEAARMLGIKTPEVQADRVMALRRLSSQFANTWVVLKGHQTLVGRADGSLFVNPSGNPHLAQGGSGDVLSGYVAGLLAQPALRKDPLLALRYAVWQHGATADWLQRSQRNWIVEELLQALGNSV